MFWFLNFYMMYSINIHVHRFYDPPRAERHYTARIYEGRRGW